jgi:hypothetical protein
MPRFLSRHRNHMIKTPYGLVQFEEGICELPEGNQAAFLREHSVFGVTVFEDKVVETEGYSCPNCGREFKNPQGLGAHMRHCQEQEGE